MKKIRVYLDTSAIGGYFDEEFRIHSRLLVNGILNDEYEGLLSSVVVSECLRAPLEVRDLMNQLRSVVPVLEVTSEMIILAEKYLEEKIVSQSYRDDALHIAVATVSRADVLVSWNFKHIVNYRRIHGFNGINFKEGYPLLDIRTPREVIDGDE